ncbi:MAG: AAA family ATPase [Gemmatimonadales bacterium]|nr:AAA family ATPase [Gemmatimonadales bacterium]
MERLSLDLFHLTSNDILSSEVIGLSDVGAFLDGFEIPDTPEFGLWKDRQQARFLPMIKGALVERIDRCRRTGNSRQIEQLADRMLVLDELSEEAIRAKIEARAMAGDRLTALKVFEDWKERLWAELGAKPCGSLERMAVTMRRGGWERTSISDIRAVPAERGRERAFIGRAAEYGLLYETWEHLKAGRPEHTLVLGDSGVGKTTLVERLTSAASLHGAAVVRVQAHDPERNVPFATLGGLISGLLNQSGASAASAEALAELARTAPDIRRRFPMLPLAMDSHGETARIRLAESFHELVRAVAEEHPLILIVDDLHLADEASLSVIHLVLRRASDQPVLALFTARPVELEKSSQAVVLRDSMARLGSREICLAPLNQEGTGELLDSLLHTDAVKPVPSIRRALISASGGIPMVLELLVQDWRANGSRALALALDAMTTDFSGNIDPSAAYGHILSRLTGAMNPIARSALDLASILGSRLSDLSIYAVVDLSLAQTMAALGQLTELRILREGAKGLEFTNELVRAHAYAAIPSAVRKALHASVADRLFHPEGMAQSAPGLEIAWHTMRAGRHEEAIPYLLEGATLALRSGAPQSAETALSSALPGLEGNDLVNATILLVEALQEQGRWRESLDAISDMGTACNDGRDQEMFALAALAKANLGPLSSYELVEIVPLLKDIMRSCPHIVSRIRAARVAAHTISPWRNRKLASEFLEIVDTIPYQQLDIEARGLYGLTRAILLSHAGSLELSFEQARSSLQDLETRGITNTVLAQLQMGLGVLRGRQGRYEEAAQHQERALRTAFSMANDTLIQVNAANLALYYGRLGRYDEQLRTACSSPSTTAFGGVKLVDLQLAFCVAFAHAILGRPTEAVAAIEAAEAALGSDTPTWIIQSWLFWKADALAVAGYRETACEVATQAVHGFGMTLESNAFAGPFARWTAITCLGEAGEEQGRKVVAALEQDLEEYDEIDQVEILWANAHFGGRPGDDYRHRISQKVGQLPACTTMQLRSLGVTQFI